MKIEDIHEVLERGGRVHWENMSYELRYEPCDEPNKYSRLSHKDGKAIIIWHSNGSSGGWLREKNLEKCFPNPYNGMLKFYKSANLTK